MQEKLEKLKQDRKVNPANRRPGRQEPPVPPMLMVEPPVNPGPPLCMQQHDERPYDEEALQRMRSQLQNDSDAFLLNNILLSVQFFENYER